MRCYLYTDRQIYGVFIWLNERVFYNIQWTKRFRKTKYKQNYFDIFEKENHIVENWFGIHTIFKPVTVAWS